MVELCGARMVPGTIDEYPRPAEPRVVPLRTDRMERLLGERDRRRRPPTGSWSGSASAQTDDGWLRARPGATPTSSARPT